MTDTPARDDVNDEDDSQEGATAPPRVRAFTVSGFCRAYGIGKTFTHSLIAQGVLERRYAGKRLLITGDSAESWFASLPDQPPRKRQPASKERVAE